MYIYLIKMSKPSNEYTGLAYLLADGVDELGYDKVYIINYHRY